MALGISFGGNSSKSKSTGTFNRTSNPIVPDWAMDSTQDFLSQIRGLSNLDPSSLVNPASALETRAAATAGDLSGTPWNYEGALNALTKASQGSTPTVAAESLLTGLDSYRLPVDDVVRAALADFDANSGATRAAQDLAIAGQGAFGGSGAALTKSLTEGELARGRASTDSNLRFTALDKAMGYSADDANRRQAASTTNAANAAADLNRKIAAAAGIVGTADAYNNTQRQNAGFMADLGGILRGIDDAKSRAGVDLLGTQLQFANLLNLPSYFGEEESGTSTTKGKNSGFSFGASAGTK